MIAIIDYGMGNLRSVQKALEKAGARASITQNADDLAKAQKIVLPGVGAMRPAMEKLNSMGMPEAIRKAIAGKKPFLGICLGLQLLFEKGDEGGGVTGLGILPGTVGRFTKLKVPHMGWNQLILKKDNCPFLKGISNGANVYFCHSYYAQPADPKIVATATGYGVEFTSSVWKDNLFAVQFHPEKSQAIGLKILENFVRL
ncbi:MAG: imidazole glycerol phosphate synthase subunit HisH [Candidatus Omnitrophota bacterium]|nr:imidazole glycerol phosphate synthase subunit HisH [Candidatus Omnitrophota bacterium]MDZ4243293.1 imidazole glycerol phosphate synthase subunit HisH [Candidatus Omnitrophota bacterium]